ncbi:hypothetical protein NDU88_007356 [Pleurodeles waltl]|uniref:Uncharacterized protein n=1 Tax=Pleurodeles waltl TaxID=8319 RepID=A0AAV7VRX7_PLEWA|nr:hypothetical protein NDU88_007356 [Pleurodeles waltl]
MASGPQYPRGTCGSGLPVPEVLLPSSNEERLPGEGGIWKSLIRASGRRGGGEEENEEDDWETRPEEKEDHGKCLKNSDEPSESRDLHSKTPTPQVAHDDGSVFSEAGTGGPGGSSTENPTMLWGERGLGRYGSARREADIPVAH